MTDRIPPRAIEATGYVGDGQLFLADDGAWKAAPGGGSTALIPLTTTVGGVPELVWDADDNLVMTEAPS